MSLIGRRRAEAVFILFIFAVVGICVGTGCSGDSSSSGESERPPTGAGRWALHVNVGPDRHRVDFVPDAVAGAATTVPFTRALRTAALDNVGTKPAPASKLLAGAAITCGLKPGELTNGVWDGNGWFVFSQEPTTCDGAMRYEQITMCMADKLAQLSEDVDIVTWDIPNRDTSQPPPVIEPLKDYPFPWQILPQSDLDRFIARDLAIYTLANLAQLDGTVLNRQTADSCSKIYARLRHGQASEAEYSKAVDAENAKAIGLTYVPFQDPSRDKILNDRLNLHVMTMRSLAKMLHDLIEANVYADMSGAAHRAGQASDPAQANREVWGEEDPYNSLAHAMRVLAGRWEGAVDPNKEIRCGGNISSMDLLKTFPEEVQVREEDLPIGTQGQADGARLISSAGILVNTQNRSDAELRDAVRPQLLVIAASQAGVLQNGQAPSGFESTPEGTRAVKSLEGVADADLRFGLNYAVHSFKLITRWPTIPTAATWPDLRTVTTMKPFPYVVSALDAIGTVVQGGLGRDALPVDVSGRVYGAIAKSCLREAPWQTSGSFEDRHEVSSVFQDSFAVAHTVLARLQELEVSFLEFHAPPADPISNPARATLYQAMSELRPWSGAGRVFAWTTPATGCGNDAGADAGVCKPLKVHVELRGFAPKELGLPEQPTKDDVARVLAMADDGECAAALRTDCPNVPITTISPADVVSIEKAYGEEKIIKLEFGDVRIPQWLISHNGNSGHGKLIAPLYGAYLDAPMRRELTNKLFSFANGERSHDPRVGDRGAARADAYCIKGVARDLFVPLENELTSQGNEGNEESWKHYLTAAEAAAARADNLGEKLIQIGTEQDTRREKAAQDLGQLCGDISALQGIESNADGTLDTSRASESLKVCMKEPQCDLVFLADNPTNPTHDSLEELLRCKSDPSNPVCGKITKKLPIEDCEKVWKPENKLNPENFITIGSLKLFRYHDPNKVAPTCDSVTTVNNSIRERGLDPAAFGQMLSQRWALRDELHTVGYGLQMRVSPTTLQCDSSGPCETERTAQWQVVGGGVVMDSAAKDPDAPIWPSCLRGNPAKCKFDDPNTNTRFFNNLFRARCPGGGSSRETCALGAPEGGNEMAEVNILRWRVQGALWMLGMLGGDVPRGMFVTPVPAVDFGVPPGQGQPALISTIYGLSFFLPDGTLVKSGATGSVPEDAEKVGKTIRVSETPFTAWNQSFSTLPVWYGDIFGSAKDRHRLIVGVENDEEPYKDDDNAATGWINESGRLQSIADSAGGSQCPDYAGQPSGGQLTTAAARDQLVARLAFIKGAWSDEDRMATRGQPGTWFSPSPHKTRAFDPNVVSPDFKDMFFVHYDPGHNAHYEVRHWFNSWGTGDRRKDRPIDVGCNAPDFPEDDDGWFGGNLGGNDNCWHMRTSGRYASFGDKGDTYNTRVTSMMPSARAKAFLNVGAAADACSALSEFTAAYGLACHVASSDAGGKAPAVLPQPPSVETANDLPRFRRWLAQLTLKVRERASNYYVQSVPLRAVKDVLAQQVARGTIKGLHGDTVVQIENTLNGLGTDWETIVAALGSLNDDLAATEKIIAGLQRESDARAKVLSLQLAQAIIADAGSVISGIASVAQQNYSGIGNIVSGAGGIATSILITEAQKDAQKAQLDNSILSQLIELSKKSTDTIAQASKALTALRTDANNVSALGNNLLYQQDLAAYYAAQGTGADYVKTSSGALTTIPLNTVLRRQFAGTRNRYMQALQDAKSLAYIARRSIEQRIGVSMSDIHEAIGPLEAPATWADSVCHLTGINYAKLRAVGGTQSGTDAGTVLEPALGDGGYDRAAIDAYTDAFVGDYVAQLRNFVDFYNIQYPSHEADDTTVLSLREDFLPRDTSCTLPAPNLLYYSSQLHMQAIGNPFAGGKPGWEYTPCISAQKCLSAEKMQGYPDGLAPSTAARSQVTLLVDRAFPPFDDGSAAPQPTDSRPGRVVKDVLPGYVTQAVALEPGKYMLSWWDQARSVAGGQDGGTTSQERYRFAVFAEKIDAGTGKVKWEPLGTSRIFGADYIFDDACNDGGQCTPHVPSDKNPWSDRHGRSFDVLATGVYHIAFAASGTDNATKGAVAIAGVQVESALKGDVPTTYVETTSRREDYSAVCPAPGAKQLQASFTRSCDDFSAECFYDLDVPILIDEVTLQKGQSSLSNKLARGNFNYRHIDLAVNLVGANVHQCPPGSPTSCGDTRFTSYSLFHDAQQVPILDWSGTPHYFDFGTGRVERGKGLTIGRPIKLPFEADVQGMLALPGVQRLEYRGRPLDGRYRLRIWDDPALQWSQLQDIQVLVRHRYWSKVDRPSGTR